MKTITGLTKPVTGMDGTILIEGERAVTPASIIANSLGRTACDQPIRAIDLGLKLIALNGAGRIDVDDSDLAMMLDAINKDAALTNLGKAWALKALQAATDTEGNREQRRAKA